MFVKYEAKVARRLGSVYWSWRVVGRGKVGKGWKE